LDVFIENPFIAVVFTEREKTEKMSWGAIEKEEVRSKFWQARSEDRYLRQESYQ
jgi:hypothetical protein